jgi:ubiquinone/menaquinone biosynthesis C-methylase UbiE
MNRFNELINNQFWNVTFKTGLYDLLLLSSYDMSLKTTADSANIKDKSNILDVGCGSGRMLLHINNKLIDTDSKWTGLELTSGGIASCKQKIKKFKLEEYAKVISADMISALPIEDESIDIAFAHFSIYVIRGREKRVQALMNIAKTLKRNGTVFMVSPATNYNAKDQVRSSISIDAQNSDISAIRKFSNKLVYSTLGYYCEIIIAKKIHNGPWRSFTKEEITSEANDAGLKIKWSKSVYGDTSHLVALVK